MRQFPELNPVYHPERYRSAPAAGIDTDVGGLRQMPDDSLVLSVRKAMDARVGPPAHQYGAVTQHLDAVEAASSEG